MVVDGVGEVVVVVVEDNNCRGLVSGGNTASFGVVVLLSCLVVLPVSEES